MDGDPKPAVGRGGRAVQRAYRTVQEGIASGRYAPGLRLTEQQVAADAGVSRTPVREALRRLHAEGVVDFRPNQGAIVTANAADDGEELFALRALLEAHGAARATERLTGAAIAELRDLAEAQHAEAAARRPGFLERMVDLNARFHGLISRAAASPRLSRALESILDTPQMKATFASYTTEELLRSATHHLDIVAAFEARDAEWAAGAMRAHVLSARRQLARERSVIGPPPDVC